MRRCSARSSSASPRRPNSTTPANRSRSRRSRNPQFNQIMKGEHDGKPAKTPVEKPAPKPVEATAPTPPAEPAKIEPPAAQTYRRSRPGRAAAAAAQAGRRGAAAAAAAAARSRRRRPRRRRPTTPRSTGRSRAIDPKPTPAPPEPPTRPKVAEKPPEKPKDPTPDKLKADRSPSSWRRSKTEDEQKQPSKPKSGDATTDSRTRPMIRTPSPS